ncbi:F-box domain containing protein [Ditylenchus destructor]|nr:F-box domain containing protein [Ditylenchus destructor]
MTKRTASIKPEVAAKKACSDSNEDATEICAINKLNDDILVYLFERILFIDRLNAELVCKRWLQLVKNRSWKQFKVFSHTTFDELASDVKFTATSVGKCFLGRYYVKKCPHNNYERKPCYHMSLKEYQTIFQRAGANLIELNLEFFRDHNDDQFLDMSVPKLLTKRVMKGCSPLSQLEHLWVGFYVQLKNLHLLTIADSFPNLKSIAFNGLDRSTIAGFKTVLEKCQKLEYVRILFTQHVERTKVDFVELPVNLKVIYASEYHSGRWMGDLLSTAAQKCNEIQSVHYSTITPPSPRNLLSAFFSNVAKCLNLKYLHCPVSNNDPFSNALDHLLHLEALSVNISCMDPETVLTTISNKCHSKLEHLDLHLEAHYPPVLDINSYNFSDMPHLRSFQLYIYYGDDDQVNDVSEEFFKRLLSHGRLMYLNTNTKISLNTICDALRNCKDLRILSWHDNGFGYKPFLDTLNVIYGETLPKDDYQIIKTNTSLFNSLKSRNKKSPHPWLELCEVLPRSPVLHRIAFQGMTSVPQFAMQRCS